MSATLVGILGVLILILVLFLLGTSVGFAMAIVGFLGFAHLVSFDAAVNMVGATLWGTFSKYGLTVIPLFILMGQVAFHSGVNARLYNAAYHWVGHIRGGLAMATIAACAAFSAICGSNTATAATMTAVALPQMKKYGYHPMLSVGAIASGSTLGVVIPPSVVLIIIGLSTEQSIGRLFYGGIGAGLVLTALFIVTVYVLCVLFPHWGPGGDKSTWRQRIVSLSGAVEMLTLFLLVILGLYFGLFTPSEAGAAGAFLAILIAVARRKLSPRSFLNALKDTLRASCMVITIVAGAVIFGKFLTVTRIPNELAGWVAGLPVSPTVVLLIVFAVYIVGGAVMDALALLMITIPIFFPLADRLGYDPIWFGVTVTVITTLGAITPPVGATTYVVAGMSKDIRLKDVFKGVLYFVPAYLVCVTLLMLFPKLVTALPALLH